jgi:hypothetical protein
VVPFMCHISPRQPRRRAVPCRLPIASRPGGAGGPPRRLISPLSAGFCPRGPSR